jgi:hypothetical protein
VSRGFYRESFSSITGRGILRVMLRVTSFVRMATSSAIAALVVSCSSTPQSTADAGRDASGTQTETGTDASAGPDADAAAKEAAPPKCSPGSVADFKPTMHGPVGPYANKCTVTQLDDAVADCFGPSETMPACDSWVNDSANKGCLLCWAGNVTAADWAPYLYVDNPGQSTYTNVAGCFALSDPSQGMCAMENEYAFECAIAACEKSCPVPAMGDTSAAIAALANCFDEASPGVCASYTNPADVCGSAIVSGGGPAAYCGDVNSNSTDLLKYMLLACGPPPSDAGPSDAGGDAH